jgi:dolichyl-phosphate beta-glucosyltransferase
VQSVTVVVPCFNEVKRLDVERFFEAARQQAGVSFVLVDDGSRDGTRDVLLRMQAARPQHFTVVALDQNGGKAEAVREGVNRAFAQAPDLVAYFDADLATPLSELEAMRGLFADRPGLQMVLGSRVGLLGHAIERSHRRHYLGRVFATAASLSLGFAVYDTQCGAKMFRNTEALRTVFAYPFRSRWAFDVEILARVKALCSEQALPPLEHSVLEYPLAQWRDISGSKLSAGAALAAATELAQLRFRYGGGWRR